MEDLSVPFRKVAAKVVQAAAGETGANVSHVVGELNATYGWKLWLAAAILVFVLYYFFIGQNKYDPNEVHLPKPVALQVAPNYLALAESALQQFKKTGDQEHYANAIECFSNANEQDPQGKVMFQLATLYHEGVPESDESKGIAPDAQSAIHYYREAIKRGYHGAVLPLASIYHWGLTGFEGNREVAKHLYGVVLKTGNDYEKGLAKDRLRQMREEMGQTVGSGMLEDDSGVSGNFTTSTFGANPYSETFMDIERSPFALGKDEATKDIDEKYVDDLIQTKLGIKETARRDGERKSKPTSSFSDPQNARDHVVVNSAKQSLERLRANTHVQYDIPTTFKMIHEYIVKKSDVSARKREVAAQVLREMAKGIANLGYEQSKEIEALHLVWNRIHSQVYANEADKRKTLMENLVNELAEAMEYGELVCPTGRLNRIIDTLNHQDPLVNIQPKWAVQQMMVARASAIQKSLLAKSSADVRDAMASTNPSARQRQLQEEFMQKVKSAIERDLTRTYVDTGMMSKELLKTELDAWIL